VKKDIERKIPTKRLFGVEVNKKKRFKNLKEENKTNQFP